MTIPTKPLIPASYPPTNTSGAGISPDGKYAAFGTSGGNVYFYKIEGSAMTLLVGATPGVGAVHSVSWSNDGIYLAAAGGPNQNVAIYKRTGDSFALATPLIDFADQVVSVKFMGATSDVLMVGLASGFPATKPYRRVGDVFTADAAAFPGDNNGARIFDADCSDDGLWAAVVTNTSPYLRVYKRSGANYVALAAPIGTAPIGSCRGVSFNADGTLMAVGNDNAPEQVTVYTRSGDVWTKMAALSNMPLNAGVEGAQLSPDGSFLVASSYAGSNNFFLWVWDGAKFVPDTVTLASWPNAGGITDQFDIAPDNSVLVAGNRGGATLIAYQIPPPNTGTAALTLPKISFYGDDIKDTSVVSLLVIPGVIEMNGQTGPMKSQDNATLLSVDAILPKMTAEATGKIFNSVRADIILPKLKAAGAVAVEGRQATVAVTLPKISFDGLAIKNPQLTFALSLPAFKSEGLAWVDIWVSGPVKLPALQSSGVVFQTIEIDGSGTTVLPAFDSDGLVFVDILGDAPLTLPAFNSAGVVFVEIWANSAMTLPMFEVEADVDDTYPIFDIDGDIVLPMFSAAGEVDVPMGLRVAVTLPMFSLAAEGEVPVAAWLAATLPALSTEGLVGVEGLAYGDVVLPPLGFRGDLGYPILVDANLTLPGMKARGGAKIVLTINAEATLPLFKVRAIVRYGDPLPATGSGTAVGLDGEGSFQLGGNIKFGNGRRTFP